MNFGLLVTAMLLFVGQYGCSGGTTCTTDADCGAGKRCNAGQCVAKKDCAADADCAADQVCDVKVKRCFANCTVDNFRGCDTGNNCDQTLKRCICDPEKCKDNANSGCHPIRNVCDVHCTEDSQCSAADSEKCDGPEGKKFCLDPSQAQHECAEDKDCTDANKPVCDTAAFPRKCIPKPGCKSNEDCKANAGTPACNVTTGQCVECAADADCAAKGQDLICDNENKCKPKPIEACVDTATCYKKDPKSYCDETSKETGCKMATVSCKADNETKNDNSSWENGIKDGKGSTIWGVQTKRMSTDNCVDPAKQNGQNVPCTDDSDCAGIGSEKCWQKKLCIVRITNGTVEISFSFYHSKGAFKTGYTDTVATHGSDLAGSLSIEEGDETSGKAKFSLCINAGGSYQFFVLDDNGDPSNALCYSIDPK